MNQMQHLLLNLLGTLQGVVEKPFARTLANVGSFA
jgi:hypothetical protein